ncbi:lipase family protein [Shewanella ulleungensis]|uniref:lipase family protein n=1 Tax=Shewanella ulleungensis TaxID=2282699 RepID=UPI003D79D5A3
MIYIREGYTITDLHCGVTCSSNNKTVHAGFNKTFESIKSQLAILLDQLGNRPVHCVGHSLGGAIANLAAVWIRSNYKIPVKLYTFGSPRVGFNAYAMQTETSLHGIYRAVHRSDPVPMVPVWPFVHAGKEYRLSTCVSLTGASHMMDGKRLGNYTYFLKFHGNRLSISGAVRHCSFRKAMM